MASEPEALQAEVTADMPWHSPASAKGTLRIEDDNLVLDPQTRLRIEIPLVSITRSSVESAFGVLPALHVWHTVQGQEFLSRFEFTSSAEEDGGQDDGGSGLSDRMGPGVARDAAQRLESGFRILRGGLQFGRETARQAVEGLARMDEYRRWPAALSQAQERAKKRQPVQREQAPASTERQPIVPAGAAPPSGDDEAIWRWFRDMVPAWLAAAGDRARGLGVRGVPVIQPFYPLDSPICRIVLVGEFSRGKSTMINALFGIHGEIALPTGMTPTTPVACAIRVPNVGESDGATVSYRTRRPTLELTLDEFRQSVRVEDEAATGQRLHLDEARRVEVRVTGAYLPAGVEIEDTPGINEQEGRSAGALSAVGRADLILFVLAADQLLGDVERDIVDNVLIEERHRNVLFLVNFWDSIESEKDRQILRQRAEGQLRHFPIPFRDATGPAAGIFYVSALQAARAQRLRTAAPEESGIPSLRARLRELLGPQSSALIVRSRAGRARRYTHILRHLVSRTAADLLSGAGLNAAGKAGEQSERTAAAAAGRIAAGLPDALRGATGRLQAALDQGTNVRIRNVEARIDGAGETDDGAAVADLRRVVLAELRALAAEYARAAQDALELVAARCRAAYLERGLVSPALDFHFEPLFFTTPSVQDVSALRSLARSAPRLLQADLEDKAVRFSTDLAGLLRGRNAGESDAVEDDAAKERISALRTLEEELLRLERLMERLIER